jgi:hypothetical protein
MRNKKRVIVEQLILHEELFATQKNKPLITDNIPNPCVKILTVKPE